MTLRKARRPARAVQQRFAPANAARARRQPRAGSRRCCVPAPRRPSGRRDRQILGRPQRRVRRPVHERVQQRPAGSLLAFDPRDVGVDPRQLQLQPEDVLQAAVAGALIEARELEDARGQPDVLEVEAQLLVGAVVGAYVRRTWAASS